MKDPKIGRALLLAGMLTVLMGQKLRANADVRDFGFDGAFYVDVAGHVRDGLGIVTDVSMYHAATPSLPWPTPIYPLWPLLLGWVSRVAPLDVAAVWLPTFFYFGTLLVGYRFACRSSPGPVFAGWWDVPDAGHLLVATLGFNSRFFEYTSRPYTEGMAFFALSIALSRFRLFFTNPGALRGLEVGVWAGVLLLIRSQMLLVGLAIGAMIGVYVLISPRRTSWLAAGVSFGVGATLTLAPAVWHVSTFADPSTLLRFEQFRVQLGMSPITLFVATDGPLDWLWDRASGLVVAFQDGVEGSYWECFGMLQWAPLIALPFAVVDLRGLRAKAAWKWLRDPENAWVFFFFCFAAIWPLSLHTIHKARFAEWNFHMRHALPCLLGFLGATIWLARRGGVARFCALYLLAYSVQRSVVDLNKAPRALRGTLTERRDLKSLTSWLGDLAAQEPPPRILMYNAQLGGQLTDGVGYDWIDDQSTLGDAIFAVERLGDRYLLLPEDRKDSFVMYKDHAAFEAAFEPVDGPSGYSTFVPRIP